MRFVKKDLTKLPLKHNIIIETIIVSIVKCILRYILMAAYILACKELGFYDYGLIAKIVVTLTSICLSRWIMREIGKMICGDNIDEPLFEDVGIIQCIRSIYNLLRRW